VVTLLAGKALVVDATVGSGGHSEALLEAGVGAVVGLDRDPEAIEEASARLSRFGSRFHPLRARFSELHEAVTEAGTPGVDGVLYDLGVSSMQLDRPERGFSYRSPGPLDMRMGADSEPGFTAERAVNTYSEEDLSRVLFEYGEERFARRIARAIVRARSRGSISTTDELAAIVAGAVPKRRGAAHPARRTFQALRIEVNRELEELAASLPQAASLLEPGGRIVVIAYHSLEDRIVKRFLSGNDELTVLTRKPMRPTEDERRANPRARSARLRAADRVSGVEQGSDRPRRDGVRGLKQRSDRPRRDGVRGLKQRSDRPRKGEP
jgi:16S rRNA (cytosine1402-N4)-methyltransferase